MRFVVFFFPAPAWNLKLTLSRLSLLLSSPPQRRDPSALFYKQPTDREFNTQPKMSETRSSETTTNNYS